MFLSGKRTAGFPLSRTQNCTLLENEGWTRSNRTERILNRPSRQRIPSTGDFFGSPLSGQTGAVPSEEGRGIHTPENLGESVARDLKAYFFLFLPTGELHHDRNVSYFENEVFRRCCAAAVNNTHQREATIQTLSLTLVSPSVRGTSAVSANATTEN